MDVKALNLHKNIGWNYSYVEHCIYI